MNVRTTLLLASCVAAVASAGCSESGFGRFSGEVVGGPSCMSDIMPFESAFQTAQPREESTMIFFQSDGGTPAGKDFINISILRPASFEVGQTYALEEPVIAEPAPMESADYVGQMSVVQSCPETPVSLYVLGDFTLSDYDGENGSRVAGTLTNGSVVDAETNEVVIQNLEGSWDFTLNTGPPYEPFP